jgi:hypothetical protein
MEKQRIFKQKKNKKNTCQYSDLIIFSNLNQNKVFFHLADKKSKQVHSDVM